MTSSVSTTRFESAPKAARLTPSGRGAVAVVKLLGDPGLIDTEPALFVAANKKTLTEQPINRIVYGHWQDEDIVVCRTTEYSTEICCHGGQAAVNRILEDLANRRVEVVDGFELVALEHSTFQTECQQALSQAITMKSVNYLLAQSSGMVEQQIDELVECAARKDWNRIEAEVRGWQSWAKFGMHLTTPWKVALIGRPNVGKSSLLNRLLGFERAIVFDQPGTTRDLVSAKTAYDGWPIEFTDTAGMRDSTNEIESAGIEKAIEQVSQADLSILLLDASVELSNEDRHLLATYPDAFVVWNKSDQRPELTEEMKTVSTTSISALTNDGVEQLLGDIVQRLLPRIPSEAAIIPFTERQGAIVNQILGSCNSPPAEILVDLLNRYLDEPNR